MDHLKYLIARSYSVLILIIVAISKNAFECFLSFSKIKNSQIRVYQNKLNKLKTFLNSSNAFAKSFFFKYNIPYSLNYQIKAIITK